MFDILLPDQDDRPLYLQLYAQIRDQIRSGGIAVGTRLPSVRALQAQLNISKTPIEAAYQMLAAEGFAISKPRSGLYADNSLRPLAAIVGSGGGGPASEPAPLPAARPPGIDFDPTAVDRRSFPLRAWQRALKEALENRWDEMGKYGDPQGEPGLRRAVAEYLRKSRGVDCRPEQIVVGTGMAYSLGIVVKLLNGVRRVAMEEPGYNLVRDQFRLNGWETLPVPVGDKGLSLADLQASGAQAAYVTPSHQFPTGSVMPYPERERLLAWAEANDAYVIEDDYDGEFRYVGKPIPSLQGLDVHGRVVYIGTFSKAFSPAVRLNYMVLPPKLSAMLRGMSREVVFAPSRVEQWAMQAFIEQGHWYRHVRRTRVLYRHRHRRLIELIQEHLGGYVEITGQNAGLHLQLTVDRRRTSRELVDAAAEAGVNVHDFLNMWTERRQPDGENPRVYLGFAGLDPGEMEAGVRLLRQAWFPE